MQGIDGTTSVLIQQEFEKWVARNGTEAAFKRVQYCLNCCGYKDLQKTHPNCDALENCQVLLGNSIQTVLVMITIFLCVYLIVFVVSSIPACIRRKSYQRFHFSVWLKTRLRARLLASGTPPDPSSVEQPLLH